MPTIKKIGDARNYVLTFEDLSLARQLKTILQNEIEVKKRAECELKEKKYCGRGDWSAADWRLEDYFNTFRLSAETFNWIQNKRSLVDKLDGLFGMLKNGRPMWLGFFDLHYGFRKNDMDETVKVTNSFFRLANMILEVLVRELDGKDIDAIISRIEAESACEPVSLLESWEKAEDIWIYQGYAYTVTGEFSSQEKKLLIMEEFDKERRHFERLKRKFSSENSTEEKRKRERIPESVRIEVWNRDGGKCARCGSRENLEYDHIVPFSRGGSNTARNIELLCEKCNRSKGNRIE